MVRVEDSHCFVHRYRRVHLRATELQEQFEQFQRVDVVINAENRNIIQRSVCHSSCYEAIPVIAVSCPTIFSDSKSRMLVAPTIPPLVGTGGVIDSFIFHLALPNQAAWDSSSSISCQETTFSTRSQKQNLSYFGQREN